MTGGALDFATFLESGESAVTMDVLDGAGDYAAVASSRNPRIPDESAVLTNNTVSSFTFSDNPSPQ